MSFVIGHLSLVWQTKIARVQFINLPNNQKERHMSQQLKQRSHGASGVVFGMLLVALGVIFFVAQWLRIDVGHWGWPFFVLLPGLGLIAVGIWARDEASQGLIIVGTVVSAVALLLFMQNATDRWSSWAYAWALIAPAAVGVGQIIYGTVKGHPEAVKTGMRLAGIGLLLFVAGAIFFELVIGIGGFGLGSWSWPLLLIVVGLVLLFRNLIGAARQDNRGLQ
jgi:hypothetical protein